MQTYKTEDEVRDEARELLNLRDEYGARAGVGQLTSFKQLDDFYIKSNRNKSLMAGIFLMILPSLVLF